MTEQELLTELAGKYHKVGTPTNAENSPAGLAVRAAEGIAWLAVPVYDVLESTMERTLIYIYVQDRGLETEAAYYQGSVPETRTETAIKAQQLVESAKLIN